MAATKSTGRVAEFRRRKAMKGEAEVRGIYATKPLHAPIKASAKLIKASGKGKVK